MRCNTFTANLEREMYNVSQSYIDSNEYVRNYISIPRRSFEQSAPTHERRHRLAVARCKAVFLLTSSVRKWSIHWIIRPSRFRKRRAHATSPTRDKWRMESRFTTKRRREGKGERKVHLWPRREEMREREWKRRQWETTPMLYAREVPQKVERKKRKLFPFY